MVNKPGVLAQVLNAFAEAKVNIIALTMMDSFEHGVMRVVGQSHEKVRKVLRKLNMQYGETDVLCVSLSNQAGALAKVTQKLSEAHINISYAYCTAGARGGRTTGVLKVADVKKAMRILKVHSDKRAKSKPKVRRSPNSKK
jgi:hypothetical protein